VHIGARLSALAAPNEVLVSSTRRDLVIGSGLEFEGRGTHELKGVSGEWHLFAAASSLHLRQDIFCTQWQPPAALGTLVTRLMEGWPISPSATRLRIPWPFIVGT